MTLIFKSKATSRMFTLFLNHYLITLQNTLIMFHCNGMISVNCMNYEFMTIIITANNNYFQTSIYFLRLKFIIFCKHY